VRRSEEFFKLPFNICFFVVQVVVEVNRKRVEERVAMEESSVHNVLYGTVSEGGVDSVQEEMLGEQGPVEEASGEADSPAVRLLQSLRQELDKDDETGGLFSLLPNEIMLDIFGYLPSQDLLINCNRVCRRWAAILCDSSTSRIPSFPHQPMFQICGAVCTEGVGAAREDLWDMQYRQRVILPKYNVWLPPPLAFRLSFHTHESIVVEDRIQEEPIGLAFGTDNPFYWQQRFTEREQYYGEFQRPLSLSHQTLPPPPPQQNR